MQEFCSLLYPEPVLFINNNEAQLPESYFLLDKRVRSYNQVHFSFQSHFQELCSRYLNKVIWEFGGNEPVRCSGEQAYRELKRSQKRAYVLEMLLRQYLCWRHEYCLVPCFGA